MLLELACRRLDPLGFMLRKGWSLHSRYADLCRQSRCDGRNARCVCGEARARNHTSEARHRLHNMQPRALGRRDFAVTARPGSRMHHLPWTWTKQIVVQRDDRLAVLQMIVLIGIAPECAAHRLLAQLRSNRLEDVHARVWQTSEQLLELPHQSGRRDTARKNPQALALT
jgi:hypothetical protein